ncbi:putative disease resistance protein At4g33300 [Silene latifolia]|uniref:putative disease resistance protein At4g33300 n=1 Tax=Silene latifolia TaxID=37657 RepID=UPI003D7809E7
MGVTDLFAGEITTELLKQLFAIVRRSSLCKASAQQLVRHIEDLFPIIQEIKYSGVELPQVRQMQLDRLSETLRSGVELSNKVLASNRWNVYKNLQLARKMEKLERHVARFVQGPMQAHVLADVHRLRFDSAESFDRIEQSTRRLESQLGSLKIGSDIGAGAGAGAGGWLENEMKRVEELEGMFEGNLGNLGVGVEVGVKRVKEMVMARDGGGGVLGICGIGGSGKTTLAKQLCKDDQLKSYFRDRILFLTVSQSPNVEELRLKIYRFLTDSEYTNASTTVVPPWDPRSESTTVTNTLVVLDDVWSLMVLEQLIFRVPKCTTVVVSRSKFPTVLNQIFEVELMNENEAMSLFCQSAFGQNSVPVSADELLVKQLVNECKGLPLALKVIGASLRGQPQMFWESAKKRLSRGEPIGESHEVNLLKRMETSISYLPEKVKECFLDLASFPEDMKIPLDVLINMWVEIHDVDEAEAFAILVELSEKHLLTLVKDSRGGDLYSSFYSIFVTQHDVLRDLAIHLSSSGNINQRRRLLMPSREKELPREWERNADQPFNAQIVSIHTDEIPEMEWFSMSFPKAEVLIVNFSSNEYFLPPFIDDMPKLRALILINHTTSHAVLRNLSVFANMTNLRSLWFERISMPEMPKNMIPLQKLRKISLVLCKIDKSFDPSIINLPCVFPNLSELTIDHCTDLVTLPETICLLRSLMTLSITNCHNLRQLPSDIGKLELLQILRVYACPNLKTLPSGMCQLLRLKYLDISQCVNLSCLPNDFGRLGRLEKIDMRECCHIMTLPDSLISLKSLRHVICDEDVSWMWEEVKLIMPSLRIQVVEECFDLDWLTE